MENIIGYLAMLLFGFWLVFFPKNVIRFYSWFHKDGQIFAIRLNVLRAIGFLWSLGVTLLFLLTKK
jgi:hypothetical protein